MKDHISACAIRRMLERPGLNVGEEWNATSGTFRVSNERNEVVIQIGLTKGESGVIQCSVTERRRATTNYRYHDKETHPLDTNDRRSIDAASTRIRSLVASYQRIPEPRPDDLAARIRDLIAADPEGAPERIAEAIAGAVRPEQASDIGDALTVEPAYQG